MKPMVISLLLACFVFADDPNLSNQFELFDKFENQDIKEFKKLKKIIKQCIKSWDFKCARENLREIKKYTTSENDPTVIRSLWNDLYDEEDRHEEYEEAQRKAKLAEARRRRYEEMQRKKQNIAVDIKYCSSNYNGSSCTVYINGSPKESISYHYEGGYTSQYNIYYKSGGGIYYTNDNKLYTPRCNKKYNVGGIGTAMYYMVKCYESGHY